MDGFDMDGPDRNGVRSAYSACSALSGMTELSGLSLLTDAAFGEVARDERLSSGGSSASSLSGTKRSVRQPLAPLPSDPLKAEAARLLKKKAFRDALRVLTDAVNSNPSDPSYFYSRSVCFSRLNDHKSALVDAEAALTLTVDHSHGGVKPHLWGLGSKILLQLARSEMQLQLLDRAFMTLQHARHLNETTAMQPTIDRSEARNCSVRITEMMQGLRQQQAEQRRSSLAPSNYAFRRRAAPAAHAAAPHKVVLSPIADSLEKVSFPTYGGGSDGTLTRIWRYRNAMRMQEELRLLPRDSIGEAQGKYCSLIQLLGSQLVPREQLEGRQSSVARVASVEQAAAEDSDLQSVSSVSSASSLQAAPRGSSLRSRGPRPRKKVLFADD